MGSSNSHSVVRTAGSQPESRSGPDKQKARSSKWPADAIGGVVLFLGVALLFISGSVIIDLLGIGAMILGGILTVRGFIDHAKQA